MRKNIESLHPSFMCIGAQKAGTTWLYDNLCQHPKIWMPPVKEIHFFNTVCPHEQLLGVETYNHFVLSKVIHNFVRKPSFKNIHWMKKFYFGKKTIRWYYNLFGTASYGKHTGDITPGYSTLDERGVVFARKVLPACCQVFVILRNPIERIWSAIKMHYRWKNIDIQKIDLDIVLKEMHVNSHSLRTDYYRIIKLWSNLFGDNFKIFLYDDLRKDPATFLINIQKYIGVPKSICQKILISRSNADQARIEMPKKVQAFCLSKYQDEIIKLDSLLPGVKDRWIISKKR